MLRARVDRPRCIGAGNCITIAPTAFDWHRGDFGKAAVVDAASVDEEKLREAALACPRKPSCSRRSRSCSRGSSAAAHPRNACSERSCSPTSPGRRTSSRRWATRRGNRSCPGTTRPCARCSARTEARRWWRRGTGSSWRSSLPTTPSRARSRSSATSPRIGPPPGFAPQVRIGVHASDATKVGRNFTGKGVHEAARIGGLAEGGEIVASADTAAGGQFPTRGSADRDGQGDLRSDRGRHRRLAVAPRPEASSPPPMLRGS